VALFNTCVCGNLADSFGGLCDRCIALQTLGLGTDASPERIEEAYHTLVKVWHPDRFASDLKVKAAAEEKLKEINGAHDYLASESPEHVFSVQPFKPQNSAAAGHRFTGVFSDLEAEEPEDTFAPQPKPRAPRLIVNAIFALGAFAVIALLWLSLDTFLSSNQATAQAWALSKTELSHEVHAGAALLSNSASTPSASTPVAEPAQETPASARPQRGRSSEERKSSQIKPSGQTIAATPYVTSGLTPTEVISVLGNPTSSSGEKMFYKGSEIDFENGEVAGWRIDPQSAPIRVKLWPDEPPSPGLTQFGVGSSKSDVIAIQGTPTLFSRNEFGYGSSTVFFRNDQVVGWKEDPASVRLKVAH
jgi:curved DNA-binding protein CbpA